MGVIITRLRMLESRPWTPIKFFATQVCKVTFKHLPQPLRSHTRRFGTLGQLLTISPFVWPNIRYCILLCFAAFCGILLRFAAVCFASYGSVMQIMKGFAMHYADHWHNTCIIWVRSAKWLLRYSMLDILRLSFIEGYIHLRLLKALGFIPKINFKKYSISQ